MLIGEPKNNCTRASKRPQLQCVCAIQAFYCESRQWALIVVHKLYNAINAAYITFISFSFFFLSHTELPTLSRIILGSYSQVTSHYECGRHRRAFSLPYLMHIMYLLNNAQRGYRIHSLRMHLRFRVAILCKKKKKKKAHPSIHARKCAQPCISIITL